MPIKCDFCNQRDATKPHKIVIPGNLDHKQYLLCQVCWDFANNVVPKTIPKEKSS